MANQKKRTRMVKNVIYSFIASLLAILCVGTLWGWNHEARAVISKFTISSLLISVIMHFIIRDIKKATICATIIAALLFLIPLGINSLDKTKDLTWLPIVVLFGLPSCVIIIIPFSILIGNIFKYVREKE